MARRRKDVGLVEIFMALPWWASLAAAGIGFAALRWGAPALLANKPLLVGIADGLKTIAWLPSVVFLPIAVIVYFRDRSARRGTTSSKSRTMSKIEPSAAMDAPLSEVERTWAQARSDESVQPPQVQRYDEWNLEALRALEWKRFELLCARYYEAVGFKTQTIRCGADGGIDVKLFKTDPSHPIAIVQCKAWNTSSVGVKEVRELLGVMAHEKVNRGIFITTGAYTKDALAFGASNPIQLLDGSAFIERIHALPAEQKQTLLRFAFEGDFRTPTCPSCGVKMVKREGKRAAFWGCTHYPRCRSTLPVRA